MASHKSSYQVIAEAETLLIYGIFLFLTGLVQLGVTMSHRFIIEKNNNKNDSINFFYFFPASLAMNDIHLWFVYPSAALTIIPCLCCIIFAICKRRCMAILICMSSLMNFISSSVYISFLIIHTLEYWQTIESHRFQSLLSTTRATSTMRVSVPFDDPTSFSNLALLITFTLALLQALLSMIGAVISCLWSPCCTSSSSVNYTPIASNFNCSQTIPHRSENPQVSTLRSVKRQQHQETHKFITTNEPQDPLINGFLNKNLPIRSNYDDV
ncbi:unnamed protein product [Rotaria socialis]|uniref:Uncharacterized protein n=1 Tax=Rotaria socialis TaxID=392032 RepID=A0A817UTT3_9BILA|nr:unnamed protein product [Rotaria socialis]CAF3460489.1 unnamed protein product [Rotaria socialis]CAF3523278.1 unnamed protein product [Rotaria socialis]CAF3551396.1 unnamed protein product [Rotaria socialis]CAF4097397.1 unnamed protein product [Rotaria socialis]